MNILIMSELFYPHGSGAELATWLYSNMLIEAGFKVTVVTKQFANEHPIETICKGIRVYRLPMRLSFGTRYDTLLGSGDLMSNIITRLFSEADVVYIPANWYSAIPKAKFHKKPVVVHLHNYSISCSTSLMYDFDKNKIGPSSQRSYIFHEIVERRRSSASVVASLMLNELIGKFYNKIGTLADALIFVSKAQRDLVLSNNPQLKDKSNVIYNPIPNIMLAKAESRGIGYFGGNRFVKGFPVLMKSLSCLTHTNINTHMTMSSSTRKTMKMPNGVLLNFLPKLDHDSFINIVKKLSVVVIPSKWPEPLPYTLIESMLYGKLIVASSIGGIPEIAVGAGAGVKLATPGDYKKIAELLDSFLALTEDEANELGIRNREYILSKLDNRNAISSFIAVLDRIRK